MGYRILTDPMPFRFDKIVTFLVSVAWETGLSLVLSETPKTGFLATRSISKMAAMVAISKRSHTTYSQKLYIMGLY